MLSQELARLVHEEREREIERRHRVRTLLAKPQPDRQVPGQAGQQARMVDDAVLARRGFVGTR